MAGSEKELMRQLPEYFRPILEFQELMKIHGAASDCFEGALQQVSANCFIATCDERTLAYYEALMQIPDNGKSLEERKQLVILQWGMQTLYTLPKLKELLASAVGTGNFSVLCDYNHYQVTIAISEQDTSMILGLYDTVFKMIPAHIVLVMRGRYSGKYLVPISYRNGVRFGAGFYPRYNRGYLKLDGRWALDRTRKLNGYDSNQLLDFYPVRMRVQASGKADIRAGASEIRMASKAQAQAETREALSVRAEASEDAKVQERIGIQTAVKWQAGTESSMTKHRYLDGGWVLSGSRKLDGGHYSL